MPDQNSKFGYYLGRFGQWKLVDQTILREKSEKKERRERERLKIQIRRTESEHTIRAGSLILLKIRRFTSPLTFI